MCWFHCEIILWVNNWITSQKSFIGSVMTSSHRSGFTFEGAGCFFSLPYRLHRPCNINLNHQKDRYIGVFKSIFSIESNWIWKNNFCVFVENWKPNWLISKPMFFENEVPWIIGKNFKTWLFCALTPRFQGSLSKFF